MDFLSEFEFNIEHIRGKENKIVDALSIHDSLMEISISSVNIYFMEKIKNSIEKCNGYIFQGMLQNWKRYLCTEINCIL